jgi:hypothetical protein
VAGCFVSQQFGKTGNAANIGRNGIDAKAISHR